MPTLKILLFDWTGFSEWFETLKNTSEHGCLSVYTIKESALFGVVVFLHISCLADGFMQESSCISPWAGRMGLAEGVLLGH